MRQVQRSNAQPREVSEIGQIHTNLKTAGQLISDSPWNRHTGVKNWQEMQDTSLMEVLNRGRVADRSRAVEVVDQLLLGEVERRHSVIRKARQEEWLRDARYLRCSS